MFTFFHRKKKIVIDCFTSNKNAYEFAPIVRGTKLLPEWWKKLPTNDPNDIDFNTTNNNMRNCYGFLELYKRSIVLPFWTDLHLKVTPDRGYQYQLLNSEKPVQHNPQQYKGGFENYYHIKLKSPWILREKTGVHFTWVGAEWNNDQYDFRILPGCLEYRVNCVTHVNMMLPKKTNEYMQYIPIGQPLVHIIPNDDAKITIKNHMVSEEEIKRFSLPPPSFSGINKLIDIKNKQSKCPFRFG